MKLQRAIEKRWYAKSPGILYTLLPLEGLFRWAAARRRKQYLTQTKNQHKTSSAPVVVIGNISVGGTGKTPIIIALANLLKEQGYKVGVVSRGYGRTETAIHKVTDKSTVAEAGDEPLEIFYRCGCDIVVHEQRAQAVDFINTTVKPDIILSDDGLQHYAMARQLEILVANAHQGFGNGHCLPVGPLREPISRASTVDFMLVNGEQAAHQSLINIEQEKCHSFIVKPQAWVNVKSGKTESLDFKAGQRISAYAGIGQPQKFFAELDKLGLSYRANAKPDHSVYGEADFTHDTYDAYVMTAKDAVKCKKVATENSWYLQVDAELTALFKQQVLEKISVLVAS